MLYIFIHFYLVSCLNMLVLLMLSLCEEHTNYFFDVAPDAFIGALDRFCSILHCALFDASGTEREMKAVDSENKKNLNNDH